MNKRIFKILLVVMAVVLFAATLFTACEKRSEVYYLSKGSEFTAYEKEEDVPQNVRFVKGGGNGEYTLTADFEQGEQFVVYNVGQSGNVVTDIFSSEQHLSLKDGKITVADKGTYALTLNTASGELSYAYTAPQTAPTVTKVEITTKTETLKVGENFTFAATVTMSDNTTNGNVTWASSQPTVATIGADGKVEALAAGTTVISATAGDQKAEITLTVESGEPTPVQPTVTKVEITTKTETLKVGENFTFAATVTMSDNTTNGNVTWASSQPTVATIGADGKVEALTAGTTIISATAGEQKAEITLTVESGEPTPVQPTVTKVEITTKTETLKVGENFTFAATVTMSDNTTNGNVTWASSQPTVATIGADGKVEALAAGTTVISATAGDQKAEITLTVEDEEPGIVHVQSISLSSGTLSLEEGKEALITVTILPADATDKGYSIALQGDIEAVEMTATGDGCRLIGRHVGTVTLVVVSSDNSAAIARCTITVTESTDIPAEEIQLSESELYFYDGGEAQTLDVTVKPDGATDKEYTYELSEEGIVTVEAVEGGYKITPTSVGEVTLTVKSHYDEQITAECSIYVDPTAVTDLQIDPTTIGKEEKFFPGDTQDITVTVLPANATNSDYTYELDQEEIVSVEEISGGYKITALAEGTVKLTVKSSDKEEITAQCEITVSKLEVTSIEMDSTLTLEKGDSHQLTYTLKPDGVEDELAWSVNPSGIVSVDNGNITALAEGVARVTAKASNGVEATCTVTVPTHVIDIVASDSFNVYAGEGAQPRDLYITVKPTEATNKAYTINVDEGEEYFSYVEGEGKITITGISVGTAKITFTSVDNPEVSHTTTINVKDISEAVPYLNITGRQELMLGDTSGEFEIKSDGGAIEKVEFSTSTYIEFNDTSADGVYKFTFTGIKIGGSQATITVTVGGQEHKVYLYFLVNADYYLLVGTVEGKTNWDDVTKATAETNNTLLTRQSATEYSITRHFDAGDSFHLVSSLGYPADSSSDNGSEMKASPYETHSTLETNVGITKDNDNAKIAAAGTYTIKLTLTAVSRPQWRVTVEDIDVTSVDLKSDNGSTLQPEKTESLKLTLTAKPDVLKVEGQDFYTAEDIEWTVDDAHQDVISIEPAEDNESATIKLNTETFTAEEEEKATITCTVKGVSATFEITLLPKNAAETPVSEIIFDDAADVILVDVSNMALNKWTYTISAHVNSDASVQGVTFSIKKNATVNGESGTTAFSIEEGVITAKMFGTVTIVATSNGNGDGGSPVKAEKQVRFYSPTFYVNIDWNSNHKTNPSTVQSDSQNSIFNWTNIELTTSQVAVLLYEGLGSSDAWTSVIRSNTYLSSSSENKAGVSGSANGCFKVSVAGVYSITLDISGEAPQVTFKKTGDIQASSSIKVIAEIRAAGTTWNTQGDTPFAKSAETTFDSSASTREIELELTFTKDFGWPNINFAISVDGTYAYYNSDITTVTFSGTKYASSKSSSKWCKGDGCQLWYEGTVTSDTAAFTFTFGFDELGTLKTIKID